MDFDQEHDDQEVEMEEIPEQTAAFDSMTSERLRMGNDGGEGTSSATKIISGVRYRECLKNHAVNIGAHAVDGCGEFIAAGEEGTLDGLKCAACNCHRNFHRKETDADRSLQQYHHYQQPYHHPQFSPFYRRPLQPSGYLHLASPSMQQRPLALPSPSGGGAFSRNEEDASNPSSSGGDGSGLKKRFRSKFTQEQKEKMLAFAERLGWRIQKHDEGAVDQFCAENCVKRQVFKVWMHNNKHTLAGNWNWNSKSIKDTEKQTADKSTFSGIRRKTMHNLQNLRNNLQENYFQKESQHSAILGPMV